MRFPAEGDRVVEERIKMESIQPDSDINLIKTTYMNAKLIRTIPALMMLLSGPFIAKAETASMLVVVEKDGTVVETPIPDVARVDFDTFSLSVFSKDGESQKYDYDRVKRVELGKATGIALLEKDYRLAVWPTVTTSTINVSGTEANDMINIYSLTGVQEISVRASEDVNVIDVTSLPSGQYVITAGKTSVRFIKK